MARMKIGVLISGRGSNLKALIEAAKAADYPAEIAVVISKRQTELHVGFSDRVERQLLSSVGALFGLLLGTAAHEEHCSDRERRGESQRAARHHRHRAVRRCVCVCHRVPSIEVTFLLSVGFYIA